MYIKKQIKLVASIDSRSSLEFNLTMSHLMNEQLVLILLIFQHTLREIMLHAKKKTIAMFQI